MIRTSKKPAATPGKRNPLLRWLPLLLFFAPAAFAQDSPVLTVGEECSAPAYAPDGRIAYAVRRILTTKRLEIERDDIWLIGTDGKGRRIVNGEKLIQGPRGAGPVPFSYAIHSLRWAPDGKRLTVEMLTSQMIDQRGNTREDLLTLLLDENGKEIKIAGADSDIPRATNAAWLGDGVTVVYLEEAVKPKLLYSVHSVRPVAGRGGNLFPEHVFVAAAWNAKQSTGLAIERDRSLSNPPRLVALDLVKETSREMATLEGYVGGLSFSPSGTKVAYFRDYQVLEIREVDSPERVARVRVAYGTYQWAPDEQHILLKRALEHRSGDLVWVSVPPLASFPLKSVAPEKISEAELKPVLHGLTFRDFDLSPDGRFVAVIQPGKRSLLVYSLR
jgi:dipeptidyl aminopeptidase/acylaminoacyl peptidase